MNYPNWICHECGMKHGNGRRSPISCWHNGKCDICKKDAAVTEPRDYGHLKEDILWDNRTISATLGAIEMRTPNETPERSH